MKDLFAGLFLAALMAVFLFQAAALPPPRYEPLGAAFLAKLVPGLALMLALLVAVRGARRMVRGNAGPTDASTDKGRTAVRTLAMLACIAAWGAAMQAGLSFRISAFAFVVASALVLGIGRRLSNAAVLLLVALVFSFGVDWLFRSYLDVILP
ncbi:MAG: tripartite tricarboxylate transporter TctB family protein [Variovorax sp.]